MNTLTFLLLILSALALVAACAWHWTRSARHVEFCNVSTGRREDGQITKLSDAAIATRYLLVKIGSDINHIAVCSAITDKPLGPCTDEPSAAEENINVALIGAVKGTLLGVSAAAITAGAYVATSTTGKLQTAVSTQFVVGRALNAASGADELVEYVPVLGTIALV